MTQRFSRRQFLRATLVSVVSAGLSACKGDGDGTTDSDGSTGTDGTEPTGSTAPTTGAEEPLLDGAAYFLNRWRPATRGPTA
ncbi:hypothetical protein [Nannocystis pusilla]|uniref:hypothetical protein n=1 Tax=Nannocystis pusilla TaxID=889268 RepID=UPI003B7ACE7E